MLKGYELDYKSDESQKVSSKHFNIILFSKLISIIN